MTRHRRLPELDQPNEPRTSRPLAAPGVGDRDGWPAPRRVAEHHRDDPVGVERGGEAVLAVEPRAR